MLINGKINFRVKVSKSKIHGRGLYALSDMPAKRKIGSLGGELISKKQGRTKAKTKESISLVELWNGKTLDASVNSNELRYINHSCQPNTYMRTSGMHVEFYTLRTIKQEEELTCNYGPTHHDGSKKCTCGAEGCKGFI
jgi:SET domain-containing protein